MNKEDLKNHNKLEEKEEKESVFHLISTLLITFILVMAFTHYIARPAMVMGNSMNDTLKNGQILIVDEVTKPENYNRFDIIVFRPENANVTYAVKRVIGLPGETIQAIDGKVYINGELLQGDFGKEEINDAGLIGKPFTLKEDEFFVMGDNRNNSADSRIAEIGTPGSSDIIGRAMLRVFPLKMF